MGLLKQIARSIIPVKLWARLRVARVRYLIRHYPARVVERIYSGIPLKLYLADPLAGAWYGEDCGELPEIRFLRQHRLSAQACVFDAGAHQGVVALVLAKIVGPNGKVVAVEANAHNAKIARRNRDLNGAAHLQIVEAAVASSSGTLVFNEGVNGQVDDGRGAWGTREVPSVSLDDLAEQHGIPDVLFLDIEGFECQALRGAAKVLEQRPDCFVEVHVGVGLETFGGSVSEVASFFPRDAYDLFMASETMEDPMRFETDHSVTKSRFFLTAIGKHFS